MAVTVSATRRVSVLNRYRITAFALGELGGRLLDVGGRDRVLAKYLTKGQWKYYSADLGTGHDFVLNLEQPLPFGDQDFDAVVALDVLEHVENIHGAMAELLRITRSIAVITLPNMATYHHRFTFLTRGRLATQKYDLLPDHQGDRHRWLTVYPQIDTFIAETGRRAGFRVFEIIDEVEGGRFTRSIGWLVLRTCPSLRAFLAARSVFLLGRERIA